MATSRATADYWQALAAALPSADAAAHVITAIFERWPQMTRSVIHRDYQLRAVQAKPRACMQCGTTISRPTRSQRYCGIVCKKQAEYERKLLRKTAGIARR